MSEKDPRILLGRITGAHGIRGDVIVESFAQEPGDIAAYGPLESEDGTRQFDLKITRVTPRGVIARIAGVSDRTAAEAMKGIALYVARTKLPAADEDEFYRADLAGLRAEDPQGTVVGTVVAAVNYGAGDLLELRLTGKTATDLIPFTAQFVPLVDVAGGRIVVDLPPSSDEDDVADENDANG
jgi:16S rRNA processing protein RimM